MAKKVTMQTIADKLNVSKVTVHKALCGKMDISPDLREKILQTSIELGYAQIDPLAKHCRWFFFLISRDFYHSSEQFYSNIFNKLNALYANLGIKLDLRLIDDDFSVEKFLRLNERFSENYGVYIAGPVKRKVLQDFAESDLPCVAIDNINESIATNFIYVDNYRAGYKLTNYLVQTGHRKICAIIDTNKSTSNLDKYFGFRKSLQKNGIAFTNEMHINADFSKAPSLAEFSLPNPLPEAFVFDCDYAAYNFYIYALSHNIGIPQNLSIASFDNTGLCLDMTPQLTSIGPDVDNLVQICHDLMLKDFTDGMHRHRAVTVSSTLHKRDSVRILN
ncbi:MAG: LacI family DNA-binding transcriptional regulator [Candidatus Fimimonas sp.]